MNLLQSMKARPRLATAIGVVVVAAVLLVVPISYTRTIGYEARLSLSGPLPQGSELVKIADEFEKALDAEDISIRAGTAGSTVTAVVPSGNRSTARRVSAAFARELSQRGLAAEADVVPITERVTGNVYAMAASQIVAIHVTSEGKTDAEIAEEIRSQLEAAGFSHASVDVETGDGQMKIEMQMCKDTDDVGPIQVSIDGQPCCPPAEISGQGVIKLNVSSEGKTAQELEAEIRAQLEGLGFENPQIHVYEGENGLRVDCGELEPAEGMGGQMIEISIDGGCCPGNPDVNAAPKSDQKSETWSGVKKKFK